MAKRPSSLTLIVYHRCPDRIDTILVVLVHATAWTQAGDYFNNLEAFNTASVRNSFSRSDFEWPP